MPFEITAPKGLNVPDGSYPAVLESVFEGEGQYGAYRDWTFLVEHDGQITALTDRSSGNMSSGSKGYQWLAGLLGKEPQVGERYEDPTGTRVLLQLEKNSKGYMKIKAVLPFTEPQQVMPGVPR
jgi:hypothetical protein